MIWPSIDCGTDPFKVGRVLWTVLHLINATEAQCFCGVYHWLSSLECSIYGKVKSREDYGHWSQVIKSAEFSRHQSWVMLALWAGAESCWKTHCFVRVDPITLWFENRLEYIGFLVFSVDLFTFIYKNKRKFTFLGDRSPFHQIALVLKAFNGFHIFRYVFYS